MGLSADSRCAANLGHRVARSTVAGLLRAEGLGPVPERPTSWRTFLAAHWGAIAAADFFTTEAWTARGLVTYYTLFVIDLASRRVQIVGSTPHPDEAFAVQMARTVTDADDGCLRGAPVLICDRNSKWSAAVPCLDRPTSRTGVCRAGRALIRALHDARGRSAPLSRASLIDASVADTWLNNASPGAT